MRVKRMKYAMMMEYYGNEYIREHFTWAANEKRAMAHFQSMKSRPSTKKPSVVETKVFNLPEPNFLNHHQAKSFVTLMKKHKLTFADLMLYDYCTRQTKHAVCTFHYQLSKLSILTKIEFQAEILGMTYNDIKPRIEQAYD